MILVGLLFIAPGGVFGGAAWHFDRKLQGFRLPGTSPSAYWFVPLRIRRDLYRAEAGPLVNRAWQSIGAMYILTIVGILLIALSS